ncbi:acyl transferase 4 [Humulus lupulus]|uniref:acyl transferase 4 n=1 Tax=Humulus lupulus TaxID=3486 RepID=UPI002B40141D|nr:acyl transferase 4 [Humulus lupulus]
MSLSVVRTSHSLVKPYEKTPCTTLQLSAMDNVPVLRCNARTLHVYRHGGEGAASAIREALSRALIPYYPLAGRLKESSNLAQLLEVDCCGEGVWFVDASVDSTLEAFNYFDDVDAANYSVSHDDLLPNQVHDSVISDQPLVQIQVTRFACDGFVMGLIFCHTICDGLGAAQFLNAVGEFARGLDRLSVEPVWCRDFFVTSTTTATTTTTPAPAPLPMPIVNYKLEEAHVDISMDQIEKLKQHFQQSTGHRCSTFEIVAASFWSCRTKAIIINNNNSSAASDHEEMVKFVFFANCRQLMQPPLPEGFYGNCFFPVTITASKECVAKASVVEVVKMIQQGKAKLGEEFDKYRKSRNGGGGGGGGMEEDPFMQPLSYNTLFVSEWGRLGFNQVDMGWGPPLHIVPIQGSPIIPAGIVGWQPEPKRGIRLMSWCVEESHRHFFLSHIMELYTN